MREIFEQVSCSWSAHQQFSLWDDPACNVTQDGRYLILQDMHVLLKGFLTTAQPQK